MQRLSEEVKINGLSYQIYLTLRLSEPQTPKLVYNAVMNVLNHLGRVVIEKAGDLIVYKGDAKYLYRISMCTQWELIYGELAVLGDRKSSELEFFTEDEEEIISELGLSHEELEKVTEKTKELLSQLYRRYIPGHVIGIPSISLGGSLYLDKKLLNELLKSIRHAARMAFIDLNKRLDSIIKEVIKQ